MSSDSRKAKIEAMLAETPQDQFLRYCLAMELNKEGSHEAALEYFSGLTRDDRPYVPSFFQAGQMLAGLKRVEEARAFLRDGIDVARKQGDAHAAGEMGEFLSSLGRLGE